MKNDTSWGGVSDWYDSLLENDNDSYQAKVIGPNLLRIVDPRAGLTVFDNACGQGFFSRIFSEAGAQVIASDISEELINQAKKKVQNIDTKVSQNPIEYHVSPADKADFIDDGSVDVETIVLAIQNIRQIDPVFAESARVLKEGGRLVLVLNHPAFRIPKESSWGFDEEENTQYRRVDSYMSESSSEILMHPGQVADMESKKNTNANVTTVSFHRPLQIFFKSLTKAGFVITRFEEWISHKKSENGPRQKAEDTARKEIPLFLCIEAKKHLQ